MLIVATLTKAISATGDGQKCEMNGNVGATGTYLMNGQTLDALAFRVVGLHSEGCKHAGLTTSITTRLMSGKEILSLSRLPFVQCVSHPR